MRPVMRIAAVAAMGTLALAGCGSKPASSGSTGGGGSAAATGGSGGGGSAAANAGAKLNACMVLDTGGVDDRSFNEGSWDGMKAAKAANPNIQIKYVPSNSNSDYVPNLTKLAAQKCDPVIAVGGLMEDAVKSTAKKNPKTHFAEIDSPSSGSNVYGIQFNTAQAGFLAGVLAAGMTKTGVVGTWGGLAIPPVTIYMDGYWEGVQFYNTQHHKNVKVLGWSEKTQKGTFVGDFQNQGKGKSITQQMASQGADIVFPVAGQASGGAGAAAQAAGGKLNLIWVDTDGCQSAAQYCKYFLTSAEKELSQGVQAYLKKASDGSFPAGNYVGTLKNKGVGLAPFHQWDSKIPGSLKKELKQDRQDIISGKIKITSPAQPKA